MYHFYKAYGDRDYEEHLLQNFKSEPHCVTTKISTLVTFSPKFFRNELEIGLNTLGCDIDMSWSDILPLDTLVINPFLDLLYEYKLIDSEGAKQAADEMINVLLRGGECEDFPQQQIELIEECAEIAGRPD